MKTKMILGSVLSLLSLTTIVAQDKTTVSAYNAEISDNLDLRAVASIFGDSRDLADFERRLNNAVVNPKEDIEFIESYRDMNGSERTVRRKMPADYLKKEQERKEQEELKTKIEYENYLKELRKKEHGLTHVVRTVTKQEPQESKPIVDPPGWVDAATLDVSCLLDGFLYRLKLACGSEVKAMWENPGWQIFGFFTPIVWIVVAFSQCPSVPIICHNLISEYFPRPWRMLTHASLPLFPLPTPTYLRCNIQKNCARCLYP